MIETLLKVAILFMVGFCCFCLGYKKGWKEGRWDGVDE